MKVKLKTNNLSDLPLLSSLLHDAVSSKFWISENGHLMLNRFRWEDREFLKKTQKEVEGYRIKSLLTINEIAEIYLPNKISSFFLILGCELYKNILRLHTSCGTIMFIIKNFHITIEDLTEKWLSKLVAPNFYN